MGRSLWKGAISFGLVHIPVEMYPAVRDNALDLTMLDRRDFSPVGFKRYNKGNNKEVVWDDIVKGYEYSDGEYVVLSEEDLRRANPEATGTIDILAFVDAETVPLLYYEQPYYLAPGKGGDKVYALLRETLRKVGKIGIATVVIRVKQHLAALVCEGDTIVLNTLRYSDEIRPADELKIPTAKSKAAAISDKELKMAMALVEGMSEDWEPEQYHDTYREDILALVEKKVKARQTKTITMPEKEKAPASKGNVIDLVALLQQSLGKKPGKGKAANDEDDGDEDEEAPPAKPRKTASKTTSTRAVAKSAAKTAAKPAAKTKAAPAKAAPARRKAA
ncbi:Ku protein [Massilia sp. CCM 9210]|uniref:non-homologous end joining protein Ku n=1 Tax=Massilia scottii TaxID=3057166 RepID=UPI00279678D5|nr:Ku protein [Massilia sp. CCM 9210]MDQ1811770.1 Ku protein [Massilia sp. CCM 9210]